MSKITHEEAIKEIKDIDLFIGHNGDGYTTTLKKYITQQKQKDELSKVKDEIISLYRDYVFSDKLSERIVIREKITTLEVKHNLRKLECE